MVALADTRHAVSFGERPSGSPANLKLRDWIVAELKPTGAHVSLDAFSGRTPDGPVPMASVIAKFAGTSGKAIAITGHFDTKKIAGVHFLGANDAGSSTGFLLEFARVLAKMKHRDDIYLVFFDGEEALHDWTETDSCYGSRHLAAQWLSDGTLSHLVALINVDMIGDKDLDILNDGNSSPALRAMVQTAAAKLGYAKYFHTDAGAIEDDHKPFAEVGVNVLDLIDFDYGPRMAYWHTEKDTMDKLSAQSLQIVGDVVLEVTKELDEQ
jgi:Zn-dependent M28 family amino/carboxypeptidase